MKMLYGGNFHEWIIYGEIHLPSLVVIFACVMAQWKIRQIFNCDNFPPKKPNNRNHSMRYLPPNKRRGRLNVSYVSREIPHFYKNLQTVRTHVLVTKDP